MNTAPRQLIAGNWKMNGLSLHRSELVKLVAALGAGRLAAHVLLCPPATLLTDFVTIAGDMVQLGGQDCHPAEKGAFTGDVSAEMLKDAGATYVIIGHSERRQYHHENDELIAAKLKAAWRAGLHPILCIGESLAEREAGQTFAVLERQLAGALGGDVAGNVLSLAYEPIWAIGTGKTPQNDEINETHGFIRGCLTKIGFPPAGPAILYGGSVNPQNAAGILALAHVGGALVGGASLKASDFLAIIGAARVA